MIACIPAAWVISEESGFVQNGVFGSYFSAACTLGAIRDFGTATIEPAMTGHF